MEENILDAVEETEDDKGGPEEQEPFSLKREVMDLFEAVAFSLILVVLVFTFIFRIVGVEGTSMVPTLHEEDRVIISHVFYKPKRGDIVVIDSDFFDEPIIKRIIATEGQVIEIDPNTQEVIVDGKVLKETYLNEEMRPYSAMVQFPLTVPEGQVFVMGDNRNASSDSRKIGPLPVDQILGHAVFRLFPLKDFGKLK